MLGVMLRRWLMLTKDPASSMMVLVMHVLSLVWAVLFSRFYTVEESPASHDHDENEQL